MGGCGAEGNGGGDVAACSQGRDAGQGRGIGGRKAGGVDGEQVRVQDGQSVRICLL